jgi:addiction module HigA family antidote
MPCWSIIGITTEVFMALMHNPPHPGETLKEDILPDLGLSVTEAAEQLGVSRAALSRVINGRAAISADMAIRLSQWLGGDAEIWLRAQLQYDLWYAQRKTRAKVKPAVRREAGA